jgi:hypothetical protein
MTRKIPILNAATSPQAAVRRVRCCNRAATGVEHIRTEQENNGARNAKIVYLSVFPTG